jgi:hypothetical protein
MAENKNYNSDVYLEKKDIFSKIFDSNDIYSLEINPSNNNVIATNYSSPNDTLELEIGDIFVGGKNSGLWIAQNEDDWYLAEPINIIGSPPNLFNNIIRGQTVILPSVANKTIRKIDIYLTEFSISSNIDYNLILELYYADDNNKPIGVIGQDYLARDVIASDSEVIANQNDFYSFDFGENGFTGISNKYAVIYRVETEDSSDSAGYMWWNVSEYKQGVEKISSYTDGVSIISKDNGNTWEVLEDYDRTIKVYYPKPEDYEPTDLNLNDVFTMETDKPKVAMIILLDESGSVYEGNV